MTERASQYFFFPFMWVTDWPKDRDFQIFKLSIETIFLIDWFGGPKPLTLAQYMHPRMLV